MSERLTNKGIEHRFHEAKITLLKWAENNSREHVVLIKDGARELRMETNGACYYFDNHNHKRSDVYDFRGLLLQFAQLSETDKAFVHLAGLRHHDDQVVQSYVDLNYHGLSVRFLEHIESLAYRAEHQELH